MNYTIEHDLKDAICVDTSNRFGATTLIISDEEIEYIMKIVKYVEDSGLSIKDIIQQSINMKQRDGFLNILLGIIGACLLGNRLAGKG